MKRRNFLSLLGLGAIFSQIGFAFTPKCDKATIPEFYWDNETACANCARPINEHTSVILQKGTTFIDQVRVPARQTIVVEADAQAVINGGTFYGTAM